MVKTYRSARGEVVDFDKIRLSNETTIAVGNTKTNARGDELGAGGKIIKSRAQAMSDYHKLNSPIADNAPIKTPIAVAPIIKSGLIPDPVPAPQSSTPAPATYNKPRGSLADSVAQETDPTANQ